MHLTWFGANAWLIELANQRILLDPWLVGPLVFGNQNWFFRAEHSQTYEFPTNIDLILLSQGLPDHAHPPTLEALDPNIPVIASSNGAKVVNKLGYSDVQTLAPSETITIADVLDITAFPGSLIGPKLVENAYVLRDRAESSSLYYEPHGFHAQELQDQDPIDVVIAPLTDLTLPFVGSFIKGSKTALELAKWVKPQVLVPTTVGGDVKYTGILNSVIGSKGDLKTLQADLDQLDHPSQIVTPPATGQSFEIPLHTRELR